MCLLIGLVIFVVMWPLSVWGHAIHLTPSWHQLMNRDHVWMHEHYSLVGLRYVAAAILLVTTVVGLGASALGLADSIERRQAT